MHSEVNIDGEMFGVSSPTHRVHRLKKMVRPADV